MRWGDIRRSRTHRVRASLTNSALETLERESGRARDRPIRLLSCRSQQRSVPRSELCGHGSETTHGGGALRAGASRLGKGCEEVRVIGRGIETEQRQSAVLGTSEISVLRQPLQGRCRLVVLVEDLAVGEVFDVAGAQERFDAIDGRWTLKRCDGATESRRGPGGCCRGWVGEGLALGSGTLDQRSRADHLDIACVRGSLLGAGSTKQQGDP
jgi:hypothetical protein